MTNQNWAGFSQFNRPRPQTMLSVRPLLAMVLCWLCSFSISFVPWTQDFSHSATETLRLFQTLTITHVTLEQPHQCVLQPLHFSAD